MQSTPSGNQLREFRIFIACDVDPITGAFLYRDTGERTYFRMDEIKAESAVPVMGRTGQMDLQLKDCGAIMDRIAAKQQAVVQASLDALSTEHQATFGEGFIKGCRMAGRQEFAEELAQEIISEIAIEAKG